MHVKSRVWEYSKSNYYSAFAVNLQSGKDAGVTQWQLALPQEHSAHPVLSFPTDPYWFRNNAFKLPSITLLPNQLCVWTLINVSLCIKRKCMSYKQSKYILLRWEKTNPLVKLLCCNQRLITVCVCERVSLCACVLSFSPAIATLSGRQLTPPF